MDYKLTQEFSGKGTVRYSACLDERPNDDWLEYHGKFFLTDCYVVLLDAATIIPRERLIVITDVERNNG